MRVKMRDTTRHQVYGELRAGDVVDVDDGDGVRWVRDGLAEKTSEAPHRQVAAEPRFAADQPVYEAMIRRPDSEPLTVGEFSGSTLAPVPHNATPEIQLLIAEKDREIARLRAQVQGQDVPEDGALPESDPFVDEIGLTEKQAAGLREAGFTDRAALDAASDDDLKGAGLSEAAIAKVRG